MAELNMTKEEIAAVNNATMEANQKITQKEIIHSRFITETAKACYAHCVAMPLSYWNIHPDTETIYLFRHNLMWNGCNERIVQLDKDNNVLWGYQSDIMSCMMIDATIKYGNLEHVMMQVPYDMLYSVNRDSSDSIFIKPYCDDINDYRKISINGNYVITKSSNNAVIAATNPITWKSYLESKMPTTYRIGEYTNNSTMNIIFMRKLIKSESDWFSENDIAEIVNGEMKNVENNNRPQPNIDEAKKTNIPSISSEK